MYRFYLAAVDLLPAALLLIPIYFLLNRMCFQNAGKSLLYYLFSCYLAVVYVLVGLPNVTYIRVEVNLNLIPLIGMIDDWKNSILNILLFVPLGMTLPLLWNKFRCAKRTVLFGLLMSLAIETLQILTFRATDVNDLITNTLGAYLGFQCSKLWLRKHQPRGDGNLGEVCIVFAVVASMMFFVYPYVSAALWDIVLS